MLVDPNTGKVSIIDFDGFCQRNERNKFDDIICFFWNVFRQFVVKPVLDGDFEALTIREKANSIRKCIPPK
jgi:hypothetical protein